MYTFTAQTYIPTLQDKQQHAYTTEYLQCNNSLNSLPCYTYLAARVMGPSVNKQHSYELYITPLKFMYYEP